MKGIRGGAEGLQGLHGKTREAQAALPVGQLAVQCRDRGPPAVLGPCGHLPGWTREPQKPGLVMKKILEARGSPFPSFMCGRQGTGHPPTQQLCDPSLSLHLLDGDVVIGPWRRVQSPAGWPQLAAQPTGHIQLTQPLAQFKLNLNSPLSPSQETRTIKCLHIIGYKALSALISHLILPVNPARGILLSSTFYGQGACPARGQAATQAFPAHQLMAFQPLNQSRGWLTGQ